MTVLSAKDHNNLVMGLIGGAKGDLAFDNWGDIRYRNPDAKLAENICNSEKLARLVLDGEVWNWELTPAGAEFILENLDMRRTKRVMHGLECLARGEGYFKGNWPNRSVRLASYVQGDKTV